MTHTSSSFQSSVHRPLPPNSRLRKKTIHFNPPAPLHSSSKGQFIGIESNSAAYSDTPVPNTRKVTLAVPSYSIEESHSDFFSPRSFYSPAPSFQRQFSQKDPSTTTIVQAEFAASVPRSCVVRSPLLSFFPSSPFCFTFSPSTSTVSLPPAHPDSPLILFVPRLIRLRIEMKVIVLIPLSLGPHSSELELGSKRGLLRSAA